MKCPSCGFEQAEDRQDCEACGLIFAKWRARHDAPSSTAGTVPAEPLPSELEIKGNLYSGYFWYEMVFRFGFVLLLLVVVLAVQSFGAHGMGTIILLLGLVFFQFILYFVMWIPRKIAVLDGNGIRFASPLAWVFFLARWNEASWRDVERVRAIQLRSFSRKKAYPIFRVSMDIHIREEGKTRTFSLQANNRSYWDLLRFVAAKVDPAKVDPRILEALRPEKLAAIKAYQEKGRQFGGILGLLIAAVVLLLPRELYHTYWLRPLIILGVALIAGFASRTFLKPPED